jgi:hypothetical protein
MLVDSDLLTQKSLQEGSPEAAFVSGSCRSITAVLPRSECDA